MEIYRKRNKINKEKGERRAVMVFVCGRNRFDFRATHFVDVVVSSELASRLLPPPPLLYLDQMLWRLEMLSTLWKKGLEKSRQIDQFKSSRPRPNRPSS